MGDRDGKAQRNTRGIQALSRRGCDVDESYQSFLKEGGAVMDGLDVGPGESKRDLDCSTLEAFLLTSKESVGNLSFEKDHLC